MLDTLVNLENMQHARWSQALATQAFKNLTIGREDLQNALEAARVRSLQRLVQALLREGLLQPEWLTGNGAEKTCILPDQSRLYFTHLVMGRMGSVDLRGQVLMRRGHAVEQAVRWPSELLTVLSQFFQTPPEVQDLQRLCHELDDSLLNDSLCLAYHDRWTRALTVQCGSQRLLAGLQQMDAANNPSLILEQWGTLGHPWHPNYKTKLGPSVEQIIQYSPEFAARIKISLCALHRQVSHVEGLLEAGDYWQWWSQLFPAAAQQLRVYLSNQGLDWADYLPLPVHPWQAEDTLAREFANEIANRLLLLTDITACYAAPTMSFRTVVPEASHTQPMVKLPVSIRLTSVQRTLSPRSARMGPRVSQLLLTLLARAPEMAKRLDILPERFGLHYAPTPCDDERARHLSVLYRDNPYSRLRPQETAIPVGSLFATDEHQQPLLRQWVQLATGADDAAAMLDFFSHYIDIAVPALLGMYLQYGIAFEAHQQNSFMVMASDGWPTRLLLRDFGDIRIHRASLHAHGLDLTLHDPQLTLFDDDNMVRDKLLHTTFMCHLGELALLCARHWTVPEAQLWQMLRARVVQCFTDLQDRVAPARWQHERHALLEADWPAKAFVRMRLIDGQTDIIGRLSNPLRPAA